MKISALFLLSCLPTVAVAADMLADISAPVQTPFGDYIPRVVNIQPQAPPCSPGDNLENVVNLDDFHFSWTKARYLKENHFFVTPAYGQDSSRYNEMFDIYNECREQGIPQFITTDAVLHGFHLMFDYILRTCEEERFIEQLDQLLEQMMAVSAIQYDTATDERVRQAIFRNRDYLLVAAQLLNPNDNVDPLPGGSYQQELELIYQAQAQLAPSPIFGYDEDYTQYKPRGHYTKSEALQRYFRAMMWLGRMTFSCEDDSDYALDMTLSAILLTQAITRVEIENRQGLAIWDDIYQPTVFFVGKSDDIHFSQYLELCYDVYGKSFPAYEPDTFADASRLQEFLRATEKFPPAAIGYPGQPRKGFRFMGQRFVPDSWILDELVFDKIPNRLWPTGLDVMIVLGAHESAEAEWAFQHLSDRDKADRIYVNKLDSLKHLFHAYPDEEWAQNAYWNWLYCLMPLLMPKADGYPYFMQTSAWRNKDLYAALASWAELRHDTILYVKQSGTERGMPPTAVEVQGYVEPNPHFYARMSSLADFMIAGLQSRNLLFSQFKTHLTLFAELSEQLMHISIAQLSDAPLSSHDYLTIFEFGKTLYDIVTFQESMPSEGPQPGNTEDIDPMPVIADVHYEANSGKVLEEGVGYPYAIYVICNIEGQPTIARGAGFSYYEFTQPASNRLTDEQWRDMLHKGTNPDTPAWASSFVIPQNNQQSGGAFFQWQKPATLAVHHAALEVWQSGDPLAFHFSIHDESASDIPAASAVLSDGRQVEMTLDRDAQMNGWIARTATSDWPLGKTFIEITRGSGEQALFYRTHFLLAKSTGAPSQQFSPKDFVLHQNYPNPFNPHTLIKIEVPVQTFISLDVFDIRGRKVRSLVSSTQPAGVYFVPWDGADDNGIRLTSGIYYYRMRANDYVDMKRMILLR